ncbi:GNAT family N-acetyltransferase [Paracoccus versutus]|uniref:GNAT family N-acetyltransferase n=1 Tax=Paracoccus versutus TaxID=34007 RepID=UPI000DF83A35|nr:N-acetyltransferase [Paracoccus versutus]RDD70848.1 N-acetyltransferase [Paracoccus versutus]
MQIEYEQLIGKARYIARPTEPHVELVVTDPFPEVRVAYYTAMSRGVRSRQIARKLVRRMVADAREEGRTIVPLCPFVRAEAIENPDWSDVIRDPSGL